MKKNVFGLALLALVAFTASPSSATPVTHYLTATVDPFNIPVVGTGSIINVYPVATYTGFPFTLNSGDTVQFDVTVSGSGAVLNTSAPGFVEFLGVASLQTNSGYVPPGGIVTPSSPIVLTYDTSTTLTVTSFAGDLVSTTFTNNLTGLTDAVPNFSTLAVGNFTDLTVTLYTFSIATTFSNIVYQPGYEYLADSNSISGSSAIFLTGNATDVPAPGALALLGLGLAGIGGLRRKKAA